MSIDMNLILFGGRLTKDPEALGSSNNGCKFDVASNRTYRDKSGERKEEPTYMSITCWSKLAELVMRTCRKGDPVLVQGRVEVRKFTDKEGNTRKYTNIVASDVRFLGTRPAEEREDASASAPEFPGLDPKAAKALNKILNGR